MGAFSILSVIFSPPVRHNSTSRCLRASTRLIFSPCPRHCKSFHSPCEPPQCLQTFLITAKSFFLQRSPLTPSPGTAKQRPAELTATLTPPTDPQQNGGGAARALRSRSAQARWQPLSWEGGGGQESARLRAQSGRRRSGSGASRGRSALRWRALYGFGPPLAGKGCAVRVLSSARHTNTPPLTHTHSLYTHTRTHKCQKAKPSPTRRSDGERGGAVRKGPPPAWRRHQPSRGEVSPAVPQPVEQGGAKNGRLKENRKVKTRNVQPFFCV